MKRLKKLLSVLMVVCMVAGMAFAMPATSSAEGTESDVSEDSDSLYRIVHLDNGRKYFSVDSIKKIIDTMADAGYNYLELAVGNDGMRFLLDDMSLTVGDTTYESDAVKTAVQNGNEAYADFEVNELTEDEMDEIIEYASENGIGIIPLINSPGHMDAILDAMTELGIEDAAYENSDRTIDVTNEEATAFTLAFVQKYIDYFSQKGCKIFNMGADEYANDVYTSGGMGFGRLQSQGDYGAFIDYVNKMAEQIEAAGMTPMAFNDGIYYNEDISDGTIDSSIMIAYWSSGWTGYNVASASFLAEQGFDLINTNGDYYWIIGGSQCSAEKASTFDINSFMGEEADLDAAGAMFCIWSDDPDAMAEETVVSSVANVITAFGSAITGEDDTDPEEAGEVTEEVETEDAVDSDETIEVGAGSSTTITIEGQDLSGNIDTANLDEAIATVDVQATYTEDEDDWQLVTNGAAGIVSGDEYLIVSGSSGNQYALTSSGGASSVTITDGKIESAPSGTVFTLTSSGGGYYLRDENETYLYPTASRSSSWFYSLSTGQTSAEAVTISGNSSVTISRSVSSGNNSTTSYIYTSRFGSGSYRASSSASNLYLFHHVETEAGTNTEITFTGVSEGTTYVTIGGTTYEIVVTDQAPSDALTDTTLEVEYWITNSQVHESADSLSPSTSFDN